MPKHVPPPIYVLQSWTIKQDGGNFYISPTAYYEQHSRKWSGPYQTLERACRAIARHLSREFAKRHRARCDFYSVPEHEAHSITLQHSEPAAARPVSEAADPHPSTHHSYRDRAAAGGARVVI